MSKTDLHYYDFKVQELIDKIRSMEIPPEYNMDYQLQLPKDETEILNILRKPSGNYDSKNKVHVNEILPLCFWMFDKNIGDFREVFQTQLREIRLGMCSQGRTIRLIQALYPFLS